MKSQPNGCHILTRVHVSGLYIHYHCLLSDLVWHGSTVLSSNTIKLQFVLKNAHLTLQGNEFAVARLWY